MSDITSTSFQKSVNFKANDRVSGRTAARRRSRRVSALALAAAAVPFAVRTQDTHADILGFGDPSQWGLNGVAKFTGITGTNATELQLTQAVNGVAGTAWNANQQSVNNFTASFQYNYLGSTVGVADGLAFVLQNSAAGTSALGGGGGSLGYSGIDSSAALEINIYNPNTRGISNQANGATGGYTPAGPINFVSTNPVNVTLTYNGSILKETFTQGAASFSKYVTIDLGSIIGATNAFVGFTGATGGENADQRVKNFAYTVGTGGGSNNTVAGVDYHWNTAEGNWTNSASWNPAVGFPGLAALDNAFIDFATPTATAHLTTDVSAGIGNLVINKGNTLSIENGGKLTVFGDNGVQLADGSNGTLTIKGNGSLVSLGTNGISSVFGNNGGSAVVNISDTGNLYIDSPDHVKIGAGAGSTGVVNQTGGTVFVNNWLHVGSDGGTGTYNLSGGSLSTAGRFQVGQDFAKGTFNMTGGQLDVGDVSEIGHSGGSAAAGLFKISGGTANFHNTGNDSVVIGAWANGGALDDQPGNGHFIQDGGTVNVSGWVKIAKRGPGDWTMSGGTANVAGRFMVGVGYPGVFNQSGGVITVGDGGDSYIMGDAENGQSGTGTVNMTGGIANVPTGDLTVGNWGIDNAAAGHGFGTFNISGTSVVNTSGVRIGHENTPTANVGDGIINQTGGTINVTRNTLRIGTEGGTLSGTYTMSGGTLNLLGGGAIIGDARGAKGTFTVTGNSVIKGGTNGAGMTVNPNGTFTLASPAKINLQGPLDMKGGSASLPVGPTLQLGGSNGTFGGVIISGGNLNLTSNPTNITMTGAVLTINGNAGTHNLPLNNISASNTSAITFNPGPGNTFTVTNNASVMNLKDSSLHAQSGIVDLSKVAVTATGSIIASHGTVAGLKEGFVNGSFNTVDPNPGQGGAVLQPRFGNIAGPDSPAAMTTADLVAGTWRNNTTIVYTGQIFIPNTNGNGTGNVAFGESFDDGVLVRIDGVDILNNNNWDNSTSSGSNTYSSGFHNVEFRFGQGGGGAGPDSRGGWDQNSTTFAPGFGIMFGSNDASWDDRTDGLGGGNVQGAIQSNYVTPIDNGSQNLFRTLIDFPGLELAVDDATTLIVGSVTGNAPLNLNGAAGGTAGATFTIPAVATAKLNSVGAITLTVTNSVAQINLGLNNTLNASNVTVPANSKLTVAGGGALAATGTVSVATGSLLNFAAAPARVTHQAGTLSLVGTGTVDINNHELLTNTAPATIKTYLANAYDPNGNQDWAKPGLTSAVAKANPGKFSVGYANGADTSAQDAGVTTKAGAPLAANQTIVRAVLAGDANMDGTVDFFDLSQLLAYKYNGPAGASYTQGDLDYNNQVDFFDLTVVLSSNYNTGQTYLGASSAAASPAHSAAASTLTGHTAAAGAVTAATTIGVKGDGLVDFEYNPATGDVKLKIDGQLLTTTGGQASFCSSLTLQSVSGQLKPSGASNEFKGGTGLTLNTKLLASALTNDPGFIDGFDIGNILGLNLTAAQITGDLTVKYQVLNGGSLKAGDVTFVPEPTSLALLGLGAAGLMARRRKNRR